MIKADLYGALSRGYCSEKNRSKTVDPDLIEAMADEILLLYCQKKGDFMGTEKSFNCLLEMNHCISGDVDCDRQSVANGYCKYYSPTPRLEI